MRWREESGGVPRNPEDCDGVGEGFGGGGVSRRSGVNAEECDGVGRSREECDGWRSAEESGGVPKRAMEWKNWVGC